MHEIAIMIATMGATGTLIAFSSNKERSIDVSSMIAIIPQWEPQITTMRRPFFESSKPPPVGEAPHSGAPLLLCQPFLPFRPRFPFAVQVQGSERLLGFCFSHTSCFATGRQDAAADHWFASRKTCNKLLRALRGNHWCRICNCSLVDRTYHYCPEIFHSIPTCLKNGMAVHKFHYCSAHLSLWYYRRGTRHYTVYYASKARN